MELVNEAEVAIAHLAALGLIEAGQVHAGDHHRAFAGQVQAPEQVQQGSLTRARGPDDGDTLACIDPQIEPLEHLHLGRPFRIHLTQIDALQHELWLLHEWRDNLRGWGI